MPMATGHITVQPTADADDVLRRATALLRDEFGLTHVTLQCEAPSDGSIQVRGRRRPRRAAPNRSRRWARVNAYCRS